MDILWPRWVARIGVTRSTQACFLTADRQRTELPLLRLPRLVHEFRGSDIRYRMRASWRAQDHDYRDDALDTLTRSLPLRAP